MKYMSFLCVVLFLGMARAQNLVPNGSFEDMDPTYTGNNARINCISDWRNYSGLANLALFTPDLCYDPTLIFPWMTILPYHGTQYIGIDAEQANSEYLEVRLNSPMEAGATYCVSYYISAANQGWNSLTTLGAYFSTTPITVNPFFAAMNSQINSTVIANPTTWTQVVDTYIATGGEEYMTIGAFEHTVPTMAYTYLDWVEVYRLESTLELGDEKLICPGEELTLDAGADGSAYVWNTGATTSSITVSMPGIYSVEKFYGGCSFFDEVLVSSDSCEHPWVEPIGTLFIPNSFTPNGDGLNDSFGAKANNVDEYQIEIFNRWGEKIFASTDLTQEWDGTYAKTNSPEGIYVYNLSYHNHIKSEYLTGHIMLIR